MISSNKIIEQQLKREYPIPGKTGVDWYIFCAFVSEFNTSTLEIGVGHGGSAISMLAYSKKLTLVDSWKQLWKKKNLPTILNNATFIECDFADFKTNETFDLIHLDANKDYSKTMHDLRLAQELEAKVIIVDDFLQSYWPSITKATFDFVKKSEYKIIFVGNFQAILAKNLSSETYKKIATQFPVAFTEDILHLTYGKIPTIELLQKMITTSKLIYPWKNTEEEIVK